MGNRSSSASDNSREGASRVFFLLHRTWAVVATDKWIKRRLNRRNRRRRGAGYTDSMSVINSEYSFCSCSQCMADDGFSSNSFSSDIFDSGSSAMSPNSDEGRRIESFQWNDDTLAKEKQRPPIYNPEDYALSLKKWGRRPPANGPGLYSGLSVSEIENVKTPGGTYRDYRNPMLISSGCEMTLRQFGTVTELLSKLRNDLRLAYPSFVQEFVADPLDGVTLLLELLRAIQLSQASNGSGNTGTGGKIPPAIQRRALLDELACLQCLFCCCIRYSESIRKLAASSAGLFTLAVCIMSNVNKSRIIALQLLTKSCEPIGNGNCSVSEALSTLRLRFGEPVRFRFLVGMLTSAGGQGELLATGMRFINTFLDTAGSMQKRIYVQAELEQAGFDLSTIKKNISINSPHAEQIFTELDRWSKNHVDVETLTLRLEDAERDNDSLRDKVLLLERRVQILQEEKGILMSLEQCLKERCSELEDEVISLKSGKSPKKSTNSNFSLNKRDGSTPEDEGISSSERSITPEELEREPSVYEVYCDETLPLKAPSTKQDNKCLALDDDEEEETTIEEVIEELRNIINDAETEDFNNEEMLRKKREEIERARIEEAQIRGKIQMRVDSNVSIDDSYLGSESEIIPSNLHPQPPRKTRSLVHLYIPTEDYYNKEVFFENETAYTSDESSDSLLSASKCQLPRVEKQTVADEKKDGGNRMILNSIMDAREKKYKSQVSIRKEEEVQRKKAKSLDRIDDGLGAMIDIVVTEKVELKSKSDVGNDRVLRNNANKQYDNPKMFLPVQKFEEKPAAESRYYFPRIQEKRATNNSFLIKRGHGNAGMYSGQNISQGMKKTDFFTTTGSRHSSSKLTDFPSGLY